MRKLISTMLVLVMVLSVFTSFSAGAAHWAQQAIDFVTENGYWIAPGELEPDRPATRAETASLFARILISKIPANNGAYADVTDDNIYGGDITAMSLMGLMVGHEDEFRPNDFVTREELACILDRASRMVSNEFEDTTYNMQFYKDRDEVSDWALQSVMNASRYVLMKGKGHKLFDPQGQTTIAEVATVVKSLADLSDAQKEAGKTTYSVRDLNSNDKIERDFDVLRSASVQLSCGYGGFGLMAELPGGTTNIYIKRTHRSSQNFDGYAHNPALFRVEDPEGNVVCRVDMDYAEGVMEKIITIPNAAEGVYRMRFVGCANGDLVSIGIQKPVNWGMMVMDIVAFAPDQTDWYFYVPKKFSICAFGIGGVNATATIWSADGKSRVVGTDASTGAMYPTRTSVTTLTPETIYKFVLPEKLDIRFGFLGLSQVICPTEEMARALQGGYIYHKDKYAELQLEGPLQVKARKRMVEIYEEMNCDLSYDYESIGVPKQAPTEGLDNPRAEAALFGAYFGTIIGVTQAMDKQVIDPSNPLFGGFVSVAMRSGETPYPATDWQYDDFGNTYHGNCFLVGALTTNAETNYWYANPVIQKRVELEFLYWVVTMGSFGCFNQATPKTSDGINHYYRQYENFQFGDKNGFTHGYRNARDFLSPQTRAITDNCMLALAESHFSQRGQGVSNQTQMGIQGTLNTYLWTNDEFFHEAFARQVDGMIYPSTKSYIGQTSPQGYWKEGSGSDGGSYGRMNEMMWDDFTFNYMTLPKEKQRPEVVEDLIAGTERFLMFDSVWYTPPINGFARNASNAWTCREPGSYGSGTATPGLAFIQNIFPRAMANHDAQVAGVEDPDTFTDPTGAASAGTVASVILSDEWAYNHLKKYWSLYPTRFTAAKPDSYPATDTWTNYRALHETGVWFDYDEIPTLPFALEGNYNIYSTMANPEDGLICGKHDGIYIINYYDHGNGDTMGAVSWMHPGPTEVWDEYFGTIIASREPANRAAMKKLNATARAKQVYREYFTEPEMVHTSIIGTDAASQFFIEGKGQNVFRWIEEGKSWAVTHNECYTLRNTTWEYYMHDGGWDIVAGFDEGVESSEEMWVQIPVVDVSYAVADAQLIYDPEACTITWAHDGHTVTLSWEKGVESVLEAKFGPESTWRHLKIRLTAEKPSVKMSITRDMGDYKFVRGIRDGK